jgi:hypothetical protein
MCFALFKICGGYAALASVMQDRIALGALERLDDEVVANKALLTIEFFLQHVIQLHKRARTNGEAVLVFLGHLQPSTCCQLAHEGLNFGNFRSTLLIAKFHHLIAFSEFDNVIFIGRSCSPIFAHIFFGTPNYEPQGGLEESKFPWGQVRREAGEMVRLEVAQTPILLAGSLVVYLLPLHLDHFKSIIDFIDANSKVSRESAFVLVDLIAGGAVTMSAGPVLGVM